MPKINILGMDPSLSNWGIACGNLDTSTGLIEFKHVEVIQTSKSKDKQIRVNSADLLRVEPIAERLIELAPHAKAIFVEVPVGSQSADAMKSYGVCIGLLAYMRALGYPFFPVTAATLKVHACNSSTASKQEMIEWATKKHPGLNWPRQNGRVVASKAEHIADAIAAAEVGLKDPTFQQLLKLLS
ncbi:ribonuclease H-like superfamily protein [Pseudomonas phage Ka3]|uniref:Putative RuvC-like holliday junction resolvase n=2 Tax=Luzseptimavirus KPP21 TaxID=1982595 RepID=A0A7S5W9H2_9CAUD|nr:putative ribonuclease H-like superfamily [Pseudomonas phage KPP21]QKE55961.1 putative RuvC-like holliday junction resolvase [Pseudomonas phage vB_Pae_AM.P2]QWY17809.1 hypothetical protein [Pseudomonas phage vB_Pae-PA152]WQZ52365.1 ribonuclease H-like superfamily protein [Pseudomonas phage Ka3]BAR94667.1 putative ribonuclease H-like superfamily [Pseudomonas phage KPP21]